MEAYSSVVIRILADLLVVPIVITAAIAMLGRPRKDRWSGIARGLVAGLLALTFAKIASLMYQGERPFVLLGEKPGALYLDNPGFPSDHVLFVFAVTFIVWATTRNKKLGLALLIMSVLVAFGRIAALVHAPVDVLGGIVCAFLAVGLVYGRKLFPYVK